MEEGGRMKEGGDGGGREWRDGGKGSRPKGSMGRNGNSMEMEILLLYVHIYVLLLFR